MSKITNPEALARIAEISESDRQTFEARMARAFAAVEFPEADPAEADPAEAEPGTPVELFNIRHIFPNGQVIGNGIITAGVTAKAARYTITEALDAKVKMEAHNPGHTFEIVSELSADLPSSAFCPLHGAGCAAWT